jgi:hypothetical protein
MTLNYWFHVSCCTILHAEQLCRSKHHGLHRHWPQWPAQQTDKMWQHKDHRSLNRKDILVHTLNVTATWSHVTLQPMEFKTVKGENRIDIKVCTKNDLRCLSNNRRNIWLKIVKWILSLGSCSVDGYYNYNGFGRSVLWQELSQKMISHVFLKWL